MGLDKFTRKKPEHTKTINIVRNSSEKSQTNWSNNGIESNKDSVIKHVNGLNFSCFHTVKVRSNPWASTYDLMNYVKPAMPKKLKALVIHTGTNDIHQETNTMKMVKELFKIIKERDSEKNTEIIFFGLIQMDDQWWNRRNQWETEKILWV